jgi:pyruvate/2-oxoacid:ferredoxin oxidoreductase alpha subunit
LKKGKEMSIKVITGNEAAAEACKLARVKIVGFFPIGPSDEVGETLVQMIRRGELEARVVDLQNERSVVNAQIVATQAGVRGCFSTNSEGLVFAYQPLFWAAYARVPILVHVAHRAMEPPTVIMPDDHDTIIFRDTHWIQFYCENPQDVLDTTLQAYRVAEDHEVLLPVFVTYAGWEVSHSSFPVEIPSPELVDQYLPPFTLPAELDFAKMDFRDYYGVRRTVSVGWVHEYTELRYKVEQALNVTAKRKIKEAHREFLRVFGRGYGGLAEEHQTADAEVVLVAMGNIAALAREVVDTLREEGKSVGMFKVRTLRPFPTEELRNALARVKVAVVLDRSPVPVLFGEVRSALYSASHQPVVMGRVIALGGRSLTPLDMRELAEEGIEVARTGKAEPEMSWRFRVAKQPRHAGTLTQEGGDPR